MGAISLALFINADMKPSNLLPLNYTFFLTDALMLLHLNYWNVM